MIVIAMRTDNPQAELYLYVDGAQVGQESWQAHRELSATIHNKIATLLEVAEKSLKEVSGIVFYQGPGSFTGLRIGISVANALGYSFSIPVLAVKGDHWREEGLAQIKPDSGFKPIEPFYGSEAHITAQKK